MDFKSEIYTILLTTTVSAAENTTEKLICTLEN